MPSLCFYFEVHQPYRLKPYDAFAVGRDHEYFDDRLNAQVMRKVANKCYLPANHAMLELIQRYQGAFRISYSITGVAIEQMREYAPEVLESFRALARTGAVEFLGETSHHSLAAVFDPVEFRAQVADHAALIEKEFGQRPTVFRNTELIYDDYIGGLVAGMGYRGMLTEGADDVLGWRSPNFVYRGSSGIPLLLKNYRLSDDIAFRFSNRGWPEFPLTADKFARWVHRIDGSGDILNLFMDYETFGEHQWADTGIFEFLRYLPEAVFRHPMWGFRTPSEVIGSYPTVADLPFHRTVSWADAERDLTAWRGNTMQERALRQIYALGDEVRRRNDPEITAIWRKLQTSDHFYYCCTKWFADGDVHAYFSPYESPYEAFIAFMNVLRDFSENVLGLARPRELRRAG
jgi:alpha-amylase